MNLKDGQSAWIKGSAAKPYVIKNTGGVYSCSCPAWRNQSVPIDKRTCKHIKELRGEADELARVADKVPSVVEILDKQEVSSATAPALLLAQTWDGVQDPTGWWMSEKLDGVRALWDGEQFVSRLGNKFYAPDSFKRHFRHVKTKLDGELWMGRKKFQKTVSIVRRQSGEWQDVYFLVFDMPDAEGSFENRKKQLNDLFIKHFSDNTTVFQVAQTPCTGIRHLKEYLADIERGGGEGIMLRQPESLYEAGRSNTLLKVKSFKDEEAIVVGHYQGKGKHRGRLGGIEVQLNSGVVFRIGTGFSDAERKDPPPVGSVVTFRYQELSTAGVPRFPAYVGRRIDIGPDNKP